MSPIGDNEDLNLNGFKDLLKLLLDLFDKSVHIG